jgi:hypothetical protein
MLKRTSVVLLLSGMIQSFTVQAFLPAAPLCASVRQQKWPLVVPRRLLGVDSGRSKQRVNGCSAARMEVGVKDTDADNYGGDSVRAFLKDYPTPTIGLAWVLRARASVLVAAVMLQVVVPISTDAGPSAFLASADDLVRSSSALLL